MVYACKITASKGAKGAKVNQIGLLQFCGKIFLAAEIALQYYWLVLRKHQSIVLRDFIEF